VTSTSQHDVRIASTLKPSRSAVRPEIQALRAIAVTSVVIYHLWPTHLPGGFVGVDVFFAISGYLIIGHLLREVDANGRIRLVSFWARRARRLLPASLLVLVITGVATLVWVPSVLWKQFFSEIGSSALYVQNWLLAANSVDYLAATNSPSPVEHFWSLSVEEQFYIAWPIVIVLVLAIARLSRRLNGRHLIAAALILLTAASFVYAVHDVARHPAEAYFVTPSRAWEFGLGGVVAYFAANPLVGRDQLRTAISWIGLAMIAGTLAVYTPQTPFPGAAALPPVAGTLIVIWAGAPVTKWAPTALMKLRPVQYLGDISYSLYLWHWPLIVLVPFALARDLNAYTRVAVLIGAVLLAGLTKLLVEDPARTGRLLASRAPWVSLAGLLTITALVAASCFAVYSITQARIDQASQQAQRAVAAHQSCVGALAALPSHDCAHPYAITALTNPAFTENDIGKGVQSVDPCKQLTDVAIVMACTVGDVTHPRTTWALIGDSHAGQFLEPLAVYGKAHGIRIITYLKSWCAGTGIAGVSTSGDDSPTAVTSCATWGKDALSRIAKNPAVSRVIFTNYTRTYLGSPSNIFGRALTASDFLPAWQRLQKAGKLIVVIRDLPSAGQEDLPACVAQHLTQYDPCAQPRSQAVLTAADDPLLIAAHSKGVGNVQVVDLTDDFCGPSLCHVVIGGLIVDFGSNHMSATFARSLAPIVGKTIARAANSVNTR
jgi:peptidoglycan/LPS O-acetylase OafA/YrhL